MTNEGIYRCTKKSDPVVTPLRLEGFRKRTGGLRSGVCSDCREPVWVGGGYVPGLRIVCWECGESFLKRQAEDGAEILDVPPKEARAILEKREAEG